MTAPLRVLVTGANGQVGRALSSAPPPGAVVRAMTHTDLDIADAERVERVFSDFTPNLIINAAAYTAVDKAETERDAAHRANAIGPRVLAGAAMRSDCCRIIHVSTDFVFDGHSSTPYRPDSPTSPLGVYGQTKLEGERAVLDVCGQRALVVRTSWVYDASGKNFLRTMLRLMTERGGVNVVSDQVGTPTATRSVARALWSLAARPQLSGVFHWTDAGVASWYDFAVAIAEEAAAQGLLPTGVRVTPIMSDEYPTAAKRPSYSVLDKRSTISAADLTPEHWRVGLRSVMRGLAGG